MLGALVLVVTWAAAGWCAHRMVRAAGISSAVTSIALTAALLAVVPGQLCRFTRNLPLGMLLAAVGFAASGAAWRLRGTDIEPLVPRTIPAWPAWIVGALGVVCVVHGALFRNFFDEDHHVPMAMIMARGLVPPEHPLAPGQVIPYHWGVDALYAQLVVAGLRPERAIDVMTVASWLLLLLAASTVGAALAGRLGSTLGVILIPLAGSPLAHPLHDGMGILQPPPSAFPASWSEWSRRPPPLTADFFQHPQGLAFPLVLVVLLLFCGSRPRRALGALLLAMLSLVQAVHFLVLGAALGVVVIVELTRSRDLRAAGHDLMLLVAALAFAVLFGGFFSPVAGTGSSLLWGRSFFGHAGWIESALHHVVVFGLPLLALPLAPRIPRLGVALWAGSVVGFLLPNLVVYAHSWDIVKLYSAAGFLAGVALSGTLASWLQRTRRRLAIVVAALAVCATIEFPLVWLASRTILQGRVGVPAKRDWRPPPDVVAAGRAVSPLIPARDLVLVNDPELGRATGLLTPGFDARHITAGHLLDYAGATRDMRLRKRAWESMDARALADLDVRWVLVRDIENERSLAETATALERVLVDGAGSFQLYRVRPDSPPDARSLDAR